MSRFPAPSLALSVMVVGLGLVACGDKDTKDDTGTIGGDGGVTDGGSDDDGGAGDSGEPELIHATVTGRVTVELYDSQTGDAVSWDDYDTFPFGPIFVAAYKERTEEGVRTLDHKGETVIVAPTASGDGDLYELPVTLAADGSVKLYAVLDWDGDTVIGTDEPRGVYPTLVEVTDEGTTEGIDITIVAPVNTGGGGCGAGTMSIRGEALVTSTWVDGNVAVMTLSASGEGPEHSTTIVPEPDGAGASGDYSLTSCADVGEKQLVGAWDSNGNGVFDPTDQWGTYLSKPDTDGNPITVGTGTLTGYDVYIPFGDGHGLSVYPFVSASGTLTWSEGGFDGLPAGTQIHAFALKYRPSGDVAVDDLEVYDFITWTEDDYAGKTELAWELGLPVNSVAFLWFYADTDADGIVNEFGEPVGSAGTDSNGRFPTGTSSTTGLEVELAPGD